MIVTNSVLNKDLRKQFKICLEKLGEVLRAYYVTSASMSFSGNIRPDINPYLKEYMENLTHRILIIQASLGNVPPVEKVKIKTEEELNEFKKFSRSRYEKYERELSLRRIRKEQRAKQKAEILKRHSISRGN